MWLLATGFLMDAYGFKFALIVLSVSYVAGIALLFLLKDERRETPATA